MMLLTDDEARKEACPHMTYCVNELGVIQDGDYPIYVQSLCQGAACKMAWRWHRVGSESKERVGYCGLAGDPYPMLVVA